MRSDVEITNFTAGELSPRMKGRTDHKAYFNGCDTCLNMVVMPQGGATERPGTILAAKNKSQSTKPKLVPFIFSTLQAYQLEFSNLNARVYMNRAPVLNMGSPVDIVLPYLTADLPTLKFAQSADTLFITHPGYPPARLTRTSHVSWTYSVLAFQDGPYLDANTSVNAVTPSGKTGSITLTWDTTAGINNGAGFSSADIGRPVRVRLFSLWAWCLITAVSSSTVVTAAVQSKVNNGAVGAIDGAAWAATTDYITGTVVLGSDGVNLYMAKTAGRSTTSIGPQGQGSSILDGTIVWSCLAARDAGTWQASTFFDINQVIFVNGNYWQAINSGKTSSDGANAPHSPSGLTNGIWTADSSMLWVYLPLFTFPTKTKNWALGVWCPANGYPYADRFWGQRLCFGGAAAFPQRFDGSQISDFTNMAPTMADGTVIASNAVTWSIDDDQVNAIHAMVGAGSAQANQLAIFTLAGEHILQPGGNIQAVTPNSVQVYNETAYGSASNVNPLHIGKAVLIVDRTGRKIREWAFYWQSNGYVGPDLLKFSEHITRGPEGADPALNGVADMVYQQAPHQVVWAWRNDGALIAFTYDKDEEVWAPQQHQLGGNYYGGPPVVESLSVIPSSDGTYDELWLAVLRTINGTVTRTIEVMTQFFDGQPADDAFFVDCGLSSALTMPAANLSLSGFINAAEETMPALYTGAGTIATDADVFNDASVGRIVRVNGGKLTITAHSGARSASATTLLGLNSLIPAPSGAWSCDPLQTTFSGLGHLNGETVAIWGDGADLGTAVVTAGSITVPNGDKASYVTAGLPSVPVLVTMPWEPLRAAGAATQGKMKRMDHMAVRFHETRGARFGRRMTDLATGAKEDVLEPMEDRQGADLMDNAPPLFSGIRRINPGGGYDTEGQLIFTREGAGPLTVLAAFARGDVAEMPAP